jgi:hypothetical protein
MSETPEQYTARILDHVDGQDPVDVLSATPSRLAALIAGASAARLQARPPNGGWTVTAIVAHLADAEIVGAFRFRTVLGAPGAAVAAYDQDAWAVTGQYDRRDPRASLDLFRALREANLALLASLAPEQWNYCGIHSERGRESIAHMVRMFAGHDVNHLRQIEAILRA